MMSSCKLLVFLPGSRAVLQLSFSGLCLLLWPQISCTCVSSWSCDSCEYTLVQCCRLRWPTFFNSYFAAWSSKDIDDKYMPDGLMVNRVPAFGRLVPEPPTSATVLRKKGQRQCEEIYKKINFDIWYLLIHYVSQPCFPFDEDPSWVNTESCFS